MVQMIIGIITGAVLQHLIVNVLFKNWSKVSSEHKKPLKWWYYKLRCELASGLYGNGKMYYKWLNKMVNECNFTLYGEKWNPKK